MSNLKVILASVAVCALLSCKDANTTSESLELMESGALETTLEVDTKTSFEFAGTYTGTLPCGDCEGIKTSVILYNDSSYKLTSEYIGKSSEDYVEENRFLHNAEKRIVTLKPTDRSEAPKQFLVQGKSLLMLDTSGNIIIGDLASKYKLMKN